MQSLGAEIAQLVEHFIGNEKVVGSIPTLGSKILILEHLYYQIRTYFEQNWPAAAP